LRTEVDGLQEASHGPAQEAEFEAHVVSAIGEAFNNIAIHGYSAARSGPVHVEIAPVDSGIEVCMMDYGVTFDLTMAAPTQPSNEPEQLPESGMGLFIIRSFMDSVSYHPGKLPERPNVLRLVKRFAGVSASGVEARAAGTTPLEPTANREQRTRAGK
jgi:serine/threonine-protein kinase RsbW